MTCIYSQSIKGYANRIKPIPLAIFWTAEDKNELLDWLQHQPLLLHDPELNFTLIHAGLPPQWSLAEAISAADEIRQLMHSDSFDDFLLDMYGNQPDTWFILTDRA